MTLSICVFSLLPGVPSGFLSATLCSVHLGDSCWAAGWAHHHFRDTSRDSLKVCCSFFCFHDTVIPSLRQGLNKLWPLDQRGPTLAFRNKVSLDRAKPICVHSAHHITALGLNGSHRDCVAKPKIPTTWSLLESVLAPSPFCSSSLRLKAPWETTLSLSSLQAMPPDSPLGWAQCPALSRHSQFQLADWWRNTKGYMNTRTSAHYALAAGSIPTHVLPTLQT